MASGVVPQAAGRTRRRPPTTRFEDWERRSGGRFFAHREMIRAGEYSDDTQLTLAVSSLSHSWGGSLVDLLYQTRTAALDSVRARWRGGDQASRAMLVQEHPAVETTEC